MILTFCLARRLNMAGFELAYFCSKHHCSIYQYYPTAILFHYYLLNNLICTTVLTEMFVIDHKEKSSCLITNNFVIN